MTQSLNARCSVALEPQWVDRSCHFSHMPLPQYLIQSGKHEATQLMVGRQLVRRFVVRGIMVRCIMVGCKLVRCHLEHL